MAELVIQSGKLKGKRLVLPAREMVVGRDDDCDLRIASSLVSRKHCILKNQAGGVLVTDLASQNGTHINDIPITEPTLMREGDTLRIGATVLAIPLQKSKVTLDSHHAKISDADIADWLMEPNSTYSPGDTAVIATVPASTAETPPPPSKATPAPKSSPSLAAPKPKPAALTVKDEAALIIQKHWELVKAKQKRVTPQ